MEQYQLYRSIPFWSWNDKLEAEQLKEQIQWMKRNGMGGYFMHARSGLQTEYLSEEWMECVEQCIREGKALGMQSWIYDENGWPSGFVGGKLLEDEKNRDQYIVMRIGKFDTNATVSYLLDGEKLLRADCCEPDGEYLNLYIKRSMSTVDILNPKVVRQFLQLTHEGYRERLGAGFSEAIEGFFTDEPQYYRWNTPYTDMLDDYWKQRFQKDILDELGLLFVEKEGYRTFRYRYWRAMQEMMLSSYAKSVYEWCDEHGVKLTGHYIEETTMGLQMMCCGGVMPFYEYMHIPGIDWLGKETTSELSPKQVGSVAAQLGKKQVLTETFACCGWDVTPAQLRRIAGFQYVNGVNLMCQHLVPYSERGSRKYDHPAHYSEINPWVKEEFETFNNYFARLGYFLGEGKQQVTVAVLHPIRSTYFDYKREMLEEGFGVAELDEQLQQACRLLSSRGIEYHFLDETLLAKYGFVKQYQIGCGRCVYDYLILPSVLTMDQTTEKLLEQYVRNGGKLLLLGGKPEFLEAEPYTYDYLESNVTLEEIAATQPYRVKESDTEIYSTYRELEGKKYLYVVNASDSKTYTQTYDCGEAARSFRKIDLTDMSERSVPLTVCLKPGEDALLCFSEKEAQEEKSNALYRMDFTNARIQAEENYLPLDQICYSTDGVTYSEPWPCPALFQKLLRERYRGDIYFRYDFILEKLPKHLWIKTEKSREICHFVNGCELPLDTPQKHGYIERYDIAKYVREGENHYTVQVDWYENPNVYYALFGENVTESLKNCIVYDTELQPIELVGDFGVYSRSGYHLQEDSRFVSGNHFYLGEMPDCVTEPSMEGFPFLAGEMTMQKEIVLQSKEVSLYIPGNYQMADVKVNGKFVGRLLFEKEIDISGEAIVGSNEIEVHFWLDNRNLMGPHHLIGRKDDGISPWSFELTNTWIENKSEKYHEDYDIKKVFG